MNNPIIPHGEVLPIVEETTNVLVTSWRNPDGGWGKEIGPPPMGEKCESDVWTTAGVAIWLSTCDAMHFQQPIEYSLRKLRELQRQPDIVGEGADGGWGWGPGRASESNATALALFAHTNYLRRMRLPVTHLGQLRAACDWLMNTMHVQAGMPDSPRRAVSLAFNTCWSVLALADCLTLRGLDIPTIRSQLERTLDFITGPSARRERGWGRTLGQKPDAIGTAYCMYLLHRLLPDGLLDSEHTMHLLETSSALLRGYIKKDGSWAVPGGRSPIEGTSWAIIALLAAGEPVDSPFIQSGIRYLTGVWRLQGGPRIGWPRLAGESSASIWMTCYACYALWTYGLAVRQLQGESEQDFRGARAATHTRIFVSHGRTDFYKHVATLLRGVELEPVILEKEAPEGSEQISAKLLRVLHDINYAIVAFDDGRPNVLQEWGVLLRQLPARNLWLLVKKGMEERIPSNMRGAEYILVDETGRWKGQLIAGLRAAGLIR